MNRRSFIKSLGIAGAAGVLLPPGSPAATGTPPDYCGPCGLRAPFGVATLPSGNFLVTDAGGYCAVEFHPTQGPVSCFGGPGSGAGRLNFPMGVAVDAQALIYICECNNCRVQVFDYEGKIQSELGSVGSIGGSFASPQGVSIAPNGRVVVADTRNHRVQIFFNGELQAVVGELGDADDQFRLPTAACVSSEGLLLVLDSKHGLIKVFDKTFKFVRSFGGVGASDGQLKNPQSMILDESDHVWTADSGNRRVQVFGVDGGLRTVIDRHGGGSDKFDYPTGVALAKDKLYVVDQGAKAYRTLSRPVV